MRLVTIGSVRTQRLPLFVVVAAGSLGGATAAAAADRPPQGNYTGEAGGAPFEMNVSDGKSVAGLNFDMRLSCADGRTPRVIHGNDFSGMSGAPPRISGKGLIRYDRKSHPDIEKTDPIRIEISGRMSAKRKRGSGKITVTYLGGERAGCTTGSVRWKVTLKRRLSDDQIQGGAGL